jgi:hypothetical protein
MRLALAVFLLVAATADLGAQRRADSVSLRFRWPTGTTARVDQEWVRVQSSPERHDSVGVRSHYRMRVLAHAEGQLISADSFVVASTFGFPERADAPAGVHQLVSQLGSYQPSFVVGSDGEFRRVDNVAQMKQLVDSILAPLLGDVKEVTPEGQAFLRNATSEQALAASAAQEWNAIVGTWSGADWVVGEAYETMLEEPVPIMPGLKIPMRYEFGVAARVPCEPTARRASCVRLELYSEPDTSALRKLTTDLLTQLGTSAKEVVNGLMNLRTMNEITLIAEPRTLRPYSVTRVRRVEASVAPGADEKGGTTLRVDIRSARYHYPQ